MSLWKKILSLFTSKPAIHYVPVNAPPIKLAEPVPNGPELPSHSSVGQVKVAIIVGHERNSPGAKMASPYGIFEYFFNTEIANLMVAYAAKTYPAMITDLILRDGIGISGAYKKAQEGGCDVAIELHFNAANTQVKGTETLCTTDSRDVDFAHIIQGVVCHIFNRQGSSRGVKCISASDRGNINVHSFPGGANCLVEPFFGDNADEAKFAMDHKNEYAQALVDAIYVWAKKVDLIKGN